MGMTTRIVRNTAVQVQTHAAVLRGLQAGGELILAASDVLAPREEGEPRHGVHLTETGFTSLDTNGPEGDRVRIGYEAFWAVWQEEDMDYHHTHGQAKFLETAFVAEGTAALELVAATIREELEG